MQMLIAVLLVVWTTARHEASHALVVVLEGGTLQEVRLLPGIHPDLGFYFGFVRHHGPTTWLTDAAPFMTDAVLLLVAWILLRMRPPERSRRRIVMACVVSALADLAYGYQGGLWRPGTDVFDLFAVLPDGLVHSAFVIVLVLGASLLRRPAATAPPTPVKPPPGR